MVRPVVMIAICLVLNVTARASDAADDWHELVLKADSLRRAAQYDSAEVAADCALTIAERAFGPHDSSVARVTHTLGEIYYFQARYTESDSAFHRALSIREQIFGADNVHVAKTLSGLASLYVRLGWYADAETLLKRALRIQEHRLGEEHADFAKSLNCLATLYYDQGRYAEAEPLYQRSLRVAEKVRGPDHPDAATCLVGLAYLYCDEGRVAEAEPLFRRVLEIRGKIRGPDHPDVAISMCHLANVLVLQARYSEAEDLFQRAVAILEAHLPPGHSLIGWGLNGFAKLYAHQGRHADAETVFRRALQNLMASLGEDHPDVAQCRRGLGDMRYAQGDYAGADSLYRLAVETCTAAIGSGHPTVAAALAGMAFCALKQGRLADADSAEARAWAVRRFLFRDGVAVLAERNALQYSHFLRHETARYLSILLSTCDQFPENLRRISDVILLAKSQIFDGILARNRALVTESNPGVTALADSLRSARFALSRLYVDGPGSSGMASYKQQLDRANRDKEQLEAELNRTSASFRKNEELVTAETAEVLGALPERTALVEYMFYDHHTDMTRSEPRVLAVVLRPGTDPVVVQIGAAEPIERAIEWYRSHIDHFIAENPADYYWISSLLHDLIWKPVEGLLSDAEIVFVVPDGELNQVSFAGLNSSDGSYLIENYPIHYLATARDLLRFSTPSTSESRELLSLGDPDYDASIEGRRNGLTPLAPDSVNGSTLHDGLSGGNRDSGSLRTQSWGRLPATRSEIMQLASGWSAMGRPSKVLTDAQASEELFKRECKGKLCIHIATHGFYLSEDRRPDGYLESYEQEPAGESPLLHSGFVLSGANQRRTRPDTSTIEDGIVTAEEIAALDLHSADLVLLSACETGLGEVKAGEGVFGLRRAFQLAGARTVISTLWEVSDQEAAALISGICDETFPPTPRSVQSAMLHMLSTRRAAHMPDHPYYWAGFIATGAWE